jgi:predicted transcriptional regulator
MWKRSRLEVYIDVLEAVSSGVNKPTNIMYKCNLSWTPMREILDSMIKKGLIRKFEVKNRRIYEITDKGRELLEYMGNVEEMLAVPRQRVSVAKEM